MSEDEKDWFERALQELDDDRVSPDDDSDRLDSDEPGVLDSTASKITDETEVDDSTSEPEDTAPESRGKPPTDGPDEADGTTLDDPNDGVTAADSGADADLPDAFGEVGDDEADGPSGGDFGLGESRGDGEVSFGENSGSEEFGFGEGGDDEFGFGDFGESGGGSGGGGSFDDEEFDSDIERIELGIDGLDEMILGGVPRRSLMTAIGSAGTGKTTFGLQFLHEALQNGDRAIYITLEESREAILSTAEEKGWPFREYEAENRLAIVALDPIGMANSLSSVRNDLSQLISDFGAERLVLDSVSLLEMMYDHPAKRRSEVFDFTRSLKQAGVTTLLTSEASEENPYASRHGIVEYLTDAVFVLQYVRPSDFRETRLAVEIQKIRDANHSRETKPYEITNEGLSVYRQANIF